MPHNWLYDFVKVSYLGRMCYSSYRSNCTPPIRLALQIFVKLSFTNICKAELSFVIIQSLFSNFVDCESFLESNSPDKLALCEANMGGSFDSGNFLVRGYLPLI